MTELKYSLKDLVFNEDTTKVIEKEYDIDSRTKIKYYMYSRPELTFIRGAVVRKIRKCFNDLFVHKNAENIFIEVYQREEILSVYIYINGDLIKQSSLLNNYDEIIDFIKNVFNNFNYVNNYKEAIDDEINNGIYSHNHCFIAHPDSCSFVINYKTNYDGKTDRGIIGILLLLTQKDHFKEQHLIKISRRGQTNIVDISIYDIYDEIINSYIVSGINGFDLCNNISRMMYNIINFYNKEV